MFENIEINKMKIPYKYLQGNKMKPRKGEKGHNLEYEIKQVKKPKTKPKKKGIPGIALSIIDYLVNSYLIY